jgi:hypothetical protein
MLITPTSPQSHGHEAVVFSLEQEGAREARKHYLLPLDEKRRETLSWKIEMRALKKGLQYHVR